MAKREVSKTDKDEERLRALEDIFLREGFRRVTVGALASRLRCSRRTLYEIAPTKKELFLSVLDRFLCRIRERGAEAARTTPDLAERIGAYLEPGIEETRRATRLFTADIASFPAASRLMETHQRSRMQGLRDIIAEGVRGGLFRGFDPHLVAEVFAFAYRRSTQPDFLAETNLSMNEAFRELSRLLRHGLLHPEGSGQPGRRTASRGNRPVRTRRR